MKHVFISYVRENTSQVDKLCAELEKRGITIWLDRENILPGTYWKDAIRRAISQGDYFLACFSSEYNSQSRSYMNEEILLAIEELRQRQLNHAWFIPVLLSGKIPDISIGPGKTLNDIQYIELNEADWDYGIEQIVKSIRQNDEIIRNDRLSSHDVNPESPKYYAEFLLGQDTTPKQREAYIRNALTFRWPLLGLCAQFRGEVKEVLLSLMIDGGFENWQRCVSLFLCLGSGFPIDDAEELDKRLYKVGRSAERSLFQHLHLIGGSVNTLLPNPYENLSDYLEFLGEAAGDSSQGLHYLEKITDHENSQIRRAAVSQLRFFRFWRSIDLLKKFIDDSDSGVCYESLYSLAWLVSGDGYWIFYLLGISLPQLGYPYKNSQYEIEREPFSIQPQKSKYSILWNAIMENNRSREYVIRLLGILGNRSDLLFLIGEHINYLQLNNEVVRRDYFIAMNLLDEKLFAPEVYYPIYKDTAIWNRWWQPNFDGHELYPILAREYYENLSKIN